jgi:hypothetical protein
MSFIDTFDAEWAKIKSDLSARIDEATGKAEAVLEQEINALKADKATVIADVSTTLSKAKAEAVAAVQANAPEAVAEVQKALAVVEQAILSAIGAHVVG